MAKEKDNKVNNNKRFMKDVRSELKKVTWPTSKQMVSNVSAVIVIVLVTAIIVFCLDLVFGAVNKAEVDALKSAKAQNQSQIQVIDDSTIEGTETNSSENDNESSTDANETSQGTADDQSSSDNGVSNENNVNTENKENTSNAGSTEGVEGN